MWNSCFVIEFFVCLRKYGATNFAICAGSITRCSDNASHCARIRSQAASNSRLMKRYLALALARNEQWSSIVKSSLATNVERRLMQNTSNGEETKANANSMKVKGKQTRVWSERIDRMEMRARQQAYDRVSGSDVR